MRSPMLLTALALGGCGETWLDEGGLWDPRGVVASGDALYVPLTASGEVVKLAAGQDPVRIDPQPAFYEDLIASPDGAVVLARSSLLVCESGQAKLTRARPCDDDPTDVRTLEVLAPATLPDGRALPTTSFEAGPWYTDFVFSADGRYVVGLQDPDASTSGGGIVNLQAVLVIDLVAGTSWEVSVGFEARRVRFLGEHAGGATGMIVLSQNEVALVDLTGAVPVPSTVYPLTLDADLTVAPVGVATTPDEAYALITVSNTPDLYVLDLVAPSINLVSLAAPPSAMAVDEAHDQTVFVYASRALAEVVDHRFFDVHPVPLDAPATQIRMADGFAVLAAPGTTGTHVARLDTADLSVEDYKLNWPAGRLAMPDDASFAVSLSTSGYEGRLEVIDLLPDALGHFDVRPKPFGLSGPPVDVAFASGTGGTTMLLLQQGVETLFQLGWPALQVGEVALPAPPIGIGAVGPDTFYVTHDSPTGLVSFWRPGAEPESVGGFAAYGVLDDRQVVLPGGK